MAVIVGMGDPRHCRRQTPPCRRFWTRSGWKAVRQVELRQSPLLRPPAAARDSLQARQVLQGAVIAGRRCQDRLLEPEKSRNMTQCHIR
jgi:hypothetical protein